VVLIMTSNLPGDPKDFFRPEFVNRVDDIVRFSELSQDDLVQIVDIQLANLADRVADRRITLDVSDEAKVLLAKIGYDPAFGARPLKRVIQKEIADRLALLILDGELDDGSKATVGVDGDTFSFQLS
jgi:ATP-dependent Clp protease ATP-binding subunit ClpB